VRKLGYYIHSLISQKHFEREVERESGSIGRKEELERRELGIAG